MPFCPECRSEFQPDYDRCADCDCDLVDTLPENDRIRRGEIKHLYSTTLLEEAETIRIILQDAEINVSIENRGGAMYAVGIPTSAAPFRIMIHGGEEEEEKAKTILEEHFRNRKERQALPPSSPEEKAFQEKLKESRSTSRYLWLAVWLAPPALALAFAPLSGNSDALLLGGAYFVGIGLLAWRLGAFGSASGKKKKDQ